MAKPNKYNGMFKPGDVIAFKNDMYLTTRVPDNAHPGGNKLWAPFREVVCKAHMPCRIIGINPSTVTVDILSPVIPEVIIATFRTKEERMYFATELGKVLYAKN